MKATLEIGDAQICDAVRKQVEEEGWVVDGQVELVVVRGYSDQRDGDRPDTVSAKVKVSPKPRGNPGVPGHR